MLANWVRQRILAASTGDVLLGSPVDSFIGCSSVFLNDGKVHYSIEDGLNRETGVGTFIQATNSIIRDTPFETLVNGIYSNSVVTPMSISNEAIISVTATVRGLTTHVPVWKDLLGDFSQNVNTGYLSPDVKPLAGSVEAYMFRDDLVESLGVRFAVPHDIKVGTDMFPHIRWSPNTTSTGTVRWGIEFMVAELGTGIFKDSVTIYLEEAGSSTLDKLQLVESDVQIEAKEPDTLIIGRVFRDSTHVNDTFVGDAAIHVACLHYQADVVGTPSKDPDFYNWS
jgi:hypothetical protein